MASKNIWDVLKTTSADVGADTLLLIRGATNDVRRILPQNLFGALPLLRDVTTQQTTGPLTSEGAGDTGVDVIIDDEDNGAGRGARISIGANLNSATPAPGALRVQNANGDWYNLYVDGNGNLRINDDAQITSANVDGGDAVGAGSGTYEFDLHDEVDVELTTLDDEDRLLVSAESLTGDPNRYVKSSTVRNYVGLREAFPAALHSIADGSQTITHSLGREPKWINVWAVSQSDTHTNFATGAMVLLTNTGYFAADEILINVDTLTTTQATVRLDVDATTISIIDLGGVARNIALADVRFRYQFFG